MEDADYGWLLLDLWAAYQCVWMDSNVTANVTMVTINKEERLLHSSAVTQSSYKRGGKSEHAAGLCCFL